MVPGRVPSSRSQKVTRILKWVASGLAVLILVSAGGAWWAFRHYDAQIGRIDLPGLGTTKPTRAAGGGQTFLLVGSDNREGANAEGTGFVAGERSDTMILVHLFGKSENVELVSFPRDAWVEIPTYTDPKTGRTRTAHHSKLNSAFSQGGPALLIATLEHVTKMRIDHYLQVDFTGFKRMVDEVGGVDVCLKKKAVDRFSGIRLSAGHHHIRGDVALAFVRQRHGLPKGDIDRIARQQQFIGSLVNKVLSKGTLLDPFKLTGFLDAATSSLKVDDGLRAGDLKKLALRMRHFSSHGVLFTTVPVTSINARRGGQSVVLLDDKRVDTLFEDLRAERSSTGGKPKPTSVPASQVHVAVYNGSGVTGLGRRAADALTAAGFVVEGKAGTRGSGETRTVIRHGKNRSVAAKTLQKAFPGSVVTEDDDLRDTLEVVVGSSYTPPRTTPKPTSTSSPQPAAPVKTAEDNPCTS
ncbi:MAG TPA: LCP family protein [Mycobacteriales bacterium]|nr:LCP family protein [Mycobacteriales bacterium]